MATRRHFGSVRKLPSGRYQASYWHEGERHAASHTFTAKAAAQAWLSTTETDILRGAWIDPEAGKATLTDVADRWLKANVAKRASSRDRDDQILGAHVLPAFGSRPVDSLTRADIQLLVDGWAAQLSPSTVARMYSTLRALLNYAEAANLILRSPCRRIRLPHIKLTDRPTLKPEQLEQLAEKLGPSQAPVMWLGAVLGLRWGEVAGLRVKDLDLLATTVTVAVQLGRDGRLSAPKSAAGSRTLAAPVWLVNELAAHLARRCLTAADAEALVFVSPTGAGLRYDNWRHRVWRPACTAAGLEALRFHDLRSMAATALVAAGVDIKTAQTRLGHSTPGLTLQIYARATEKADRAAADAVGNFFRASRTDRARKRPARKRPS